MPLLQKIIAHIDYNTIYCCHRVNDCSHAICASENTVTPSTPKMLVRVYIALRGSHSHEASNRLQFFLGVGRIAYQIEITGNFYYFIV